MTPPCTVVGTYSHIYDLLHRESAKGEAKLDTQPPEKNNVAMSSSMLNKQPARGPVKLSSESRLARESTQIIIPTAHYSERE